MKQCIIYSFIVLILGCAETTRINEDLKDFNEFLGKDKAEALDQIVESFHHFLLINFPDKKTLGDRTEAFLKEYSESPFYNDSWKFDTTDYNNIITKFENSGLRKEIYLHCWCVKI